METQECMCLQWDGPKSAAGSPGLQGGIPSMEVLWGKGACCPEIGKVGRASLGCKVFCGPVLVSSFFFNSSTRFLQTSLWSKMRCCFFLKLDQLLSPLNTKIRSCPACSRKSLSSLINIPKHLLWNMPVVSYTGGPKGWPGYATAYPKRPTPAHPTSNRPAPSHERSRTAGKKTRLPSAPDSLTPPRESRAPVGLLRSISASRRRPAL